MSEISVTPEAVPASSSVRPYAPSIFDRFTDWVDRLPFPAPLLYIGLALALVGVQLLLQWNDSAGQLYAFPFVYVVSLAYHLALMHYLDRIAASALTRFRPLLTVSDAEYNHLRYRLTTLPNRSVLLAACLGALYGISALFWIPVEAQVNDLHFAANPVSTLFNRAFSPLIFSVLGVMIYHAIHQLNVVREIYARSIRIDLFTLRPLYAFSALSGMTAVGISLISYLWFLTTPTLFLPNLLFFLTFTVMAGLMFILPLRGAHHLLEQEKERLLSENGERQRVVIAELHRRVDSSEIREMDDLHKTMSGLEMERSLLERISTWPWKPETPRAVSAALLFPVVVWLLQWVLERILT